jgi:hypothetical protein
MASSMIVKNTNGKGVGGGTFSSRWAPSSFTDRERSSLLSSGLSSGLSTSLPSLPTTSGSLALASKLNLDPVHGSLSPQQGKGKVIVAMRPRHIDIDKKLPVIFEGWFSFLFSPSSQSSSSSLLLLTFKSQCTSHFES